MADDIKENAIDDKEDWLNENGDPDFSYLQSLAADGSPEALAKLDSIAEDLNVDHDADTSTGELIDRIRSVTARNEDGGMNIVT
jgi:hypothetical protein